MPPPLGCFLLPRDPDGSQSTPPGGGIPNQHPHNVPPCVAASPFLTTRFQIRRQSRVMVRNAFEPGTPKQPPTLLAFARGNALPRERHKRELVRNCNTESQTNQGDCSGSPGRCADSAATAPVRKFLRGNGFPVRNPHQKHPSRRRFYRDSFEGRRFNSLKPGTSNGAFVGENGRARRAAHQNSPKFVYCTEVFWYKFRY